MATIAGSILVAFTIDVWWDEFRDREDARVILSSVHAEFVQVEGVLSWQDEYLGAINNSAKQLLTAAVGKERELGEREIDRLLADLTWFLTGSLFEVPELKSLVRNDELSLIANSEYDTNSGHGSPRIRTFRQP